MNLFGWVNSTFDPETVQLETTQRCYRNTVRVIQESIQLDSVGKPPLHLSDTNIIANLKHLGEVFVDKKQSNSLEYMLKSNGVDVLVSLAIYNVPKGVLGELLVFLGNVIRGMPVHRIVSVPIHRPLMKVLWQMEKITDKEPILQLIHALTSKIRTNPQLFHIFFYKMTNPIKQSLARSMKDVNAILTLKEDSWVCPLLKPLLLNLHLSSSLGDVSRHALVDLLCISHVRYLDSLTLSCWVNFLFSSDLSGFVYNGVKQLWLQSTQLVTDLQHNQLPDDALLNILLLVEQLMRMEINLELKLECLRGCKEAFFYCSRDMHHLINNFSDVANEVRLRKAIDLLSKIATVLTSKTSTSQLKAEFILISRINGIEGDFGGDDVYKMNWTASLGRLFVETLCCGTNILPLQQLGDFKQLFEDVMELQTIHIPNHSLPTPLILDILRCFEKHRHLYPPSTRCSTGQDDLDGILLLLFTKIEILQLSPLYIRWQYLLMLLIRNHGNSFVASYIPQATYKSYKFENYDKQRELCWRLLAEISSELSDELASKKLNEYLNEINIVDVEIYRRQGAAEFDENLFLNFVCNSLAAIHQEDHQTALVMFSIIAGLCQSDYKLADYLFSKILPICAELLGHVERIDNMNPFKKIVFESTLELIGIWRKRAYKYANLE